MMSFPVKKKKILLQRHFFSTEKKNRGNWCVLSFLLTKFKQHYKVSLQKLYFTQQVASK